MSVYSKVARLSGSKVTIDQCRFGLVTLENGDAVKKPTTLYTNSPKLLQVFDGQRCLNDHKHKKVEGSEGGMKRSTASQIYPPQLCEAFASAVIQQWAEDHPQR